MKFSLASRFNSASASKFLSQALVVTLLASPIFVHANPLGAGFEVSNPLEGRQNCQNGCGFKGWLCCGPGQSCSVDANQQAMCINGGQAQPTAAAANSGCEIPCGSTCCAAGSYCLVADQGKCAQAGLTTAGAPVATATPPLRPTSNGVVTMTVPFETAVPTGQAAPVLSTQHHGLSAGAIAGIVIGTLAAIIILILICMFCCAKNLLESVLAIFGIGKKRHVHETTYVEDRRSSRSGSRRWHGSQGPARPERKGKFGNLAGIGAALGAAALALGMKRRHDRHEAEKSEYGTNSSYYYSDYTSSSSASSDDRRTRHTRHTGHSSRSRSHR